MGTKPNKPPRISPSRLPIFRQCQRQWYLQAVAKLNPEYSPGQRRAFVFGTKAHKVVEELLLGKQPRHGGWEFEVGMAFAYLTDRAVDAIGGLEDKVHVEIDGGHYDGIADAWGRRGDKLVVVDHKTASDVNRAYQTPEEMLEDAQVLLYSYALMEREGFNGAIFRKHWVQSKRRADPLANARESEVWVPREIARAAAEKACADSKTALAIAKGSAPLPYYETHLDPLRLRCSGGAGPSPYGCPWAGRCTEMGILDQIAKSKVGSQQVETAAKAALVPAPATEPAPAPAVNPDPAAAPVPLAASLERLTEARGVLGASASLGECTAYWIGRGS